MAKRRKRKKRTRVFQEVHETTMPMPFGYGSVFWAVSESVITAAEGMTIAFTTRFGSWDTGRSHAKSYSNIAKALAISKSYVQRLIKKVADWVKKLKSTTRGTIYQVTSHVYDADTPEEKVPINEDGKPLKFAVPIGVGGPFERMVAGSISWQACWLWLVMKLNSCWDGNDEKAGRTYQLSYETLIKKTGLSRAKVAQCLQELKNAGMVQRISEPFEVGVYQLYPKPPKTAQKRQRFRRTDKSKRAMLQDETHIYSLNHQYRIEIATGFFEMQRRKKWVSANRDKIPTHIRIEMEDVNMEINEGLRVLNRSKWGSTDSDTPSTDSDTPSTDSDTFGFLEGSEASDGLPF